MKLFSRKPKPEAIQTPETPEAEENPLLEETRPFFVPHELPTLRVQAAQSVGMARSHNEDAVYAMQLTLLTPESRHVFGLFMIADGMGGHLGGELASSLAIQGASNSLYRSLLEPLRLGQKNFSDEEISEALNAAMHAAQELVLNQAAGSGTTLTMAIVLDRNLYFAHVGDSRLYLAPYGEPLQVLTKDHSLVRRLVDLGQIDEDEAKTHPQRNVLFRALGQEDGFKADLGALKLENPVNLLLCSDGLWGLVQDQSLAETLRAARWSDKIAQKLINMANAAGGTDNISVIAVTII